MNTEVGIFMKLSFKNILVYGWEWLYLRGVFPNLQKNAVIFMLHRMSSIDVIEEGHSAEFLDQSLNYLTRKGYNFISIEEIFKVINEGGTPPRKSIAFTLDDGFIDQAKIAAPIFIKYKCPVTIFLITQFVDSGQPPWDFLVKFIFYNTNKTCITVSLNEKVITYPIDDEELRYNSMSDCRNMFKRLPESDLEFVLASLLGNIEKEKIDALTKSKFSLSWDDARRLEKSGITFGSHTISHPILSGCSDEKAYDEIKKSLDMLTLQLQNPCPVFAYPTGHNEDFSGRDINYIKSVGFQGAVTANQGSVNFEEISDADKYLVKRMSFPSSMQDLVQCSSGLELIKGQLRHFKLKLTYTTKKKLLSYTWVITKYYFGLYDKYCLIDWSNVSRLIFVCKGNICRSPYAEVMAKKLGIDAISIGLHTKEGSFADKGALKCASYRDIELKDHRVRIVESIEVFKTDLVVGMEPWHIEQFIKVNSNACQFTLLGLWCTKKKILLGDPYAKPDMFFEECFGSIDNALININKYYSSKG